MDEGGGELEGAGVDLRVFEGRKAGRKGRARGDAWAASPSYKEGWRRRRTHRVDMLRARLRLVSARLAILPGWMDGIMTQSPSRPIAPPGKPA